MEELVKLSDTSQEYWDYVQKIHQISGRLLKSKERLEDPNEEDMLFIFNTLPKAR